MKPESETTIILSESDHADKYTIANLIHISEFDNTIKHIKNALKLAEKLNFGIHQHNTITLLGSRGNGKTSFLLSVLDWIKNSTDNDLSSIQTLEIIDPTLIEEKGHVFLNVISLISNIVENVLDREGIGSNNCYDVVITRKQWRSSLTKLAEGLPSIDGIGNQSMDTWQDAEFVMDNGLKSVSASQNLRKNFNSFLEISLNIIKKKAFLLIFDDIDVDASKGWAILETIRKYFTGNRLITLISGDLELYTTVVRQKKWESFGTEILKYDGQKQEGKSGLNEFKKLVTKLTDQYMLKIMQPKYRIRLNTLLNRKLKYGSINIQVKYQNETRGTNIEDRYLKILSSYGISNNIQAETYTTFLLSQPLRTQLQFLFLYSTTHTNENESNLADINSIIDIFLADLLERNVDTSIAANSPKHLTSLILTLLNNESKLEDLYQLQPTTTDDGLNAAIFSLSLLLSHTIKNSPYVIFDYFIKIGYIRNLLTIIPPTNRNSPEKNQTPTIEGLCSRTGVLNDGILRDVVGKIQTYVYGALRTIEPLKDRTPHFVQIAGLASTAKRGKKDRIDKIFNEDNVKSAESTLGYIPCFSGIFSNKNESRLCYSFYLLLGAIGEIVKQYEIIFKKSDVEQKNNLTGTLKALSQLRAYPIVEFNRQNADITPSGNITQINIQQKSPDDSTDQLVISILTWLKSRSNNITIASYVLGKIFTRFYYAMNNIAEENKENVPLGDYIHRQIIAFMNSVVIEEAKEYLIIETTTLNINNTVTDDLIFKSNLNKINNLNDPAQKNKLTLSKWILSCPLLLAYLKKDNNSMNNISLFNELDIFTGINNKIIIDLSVNNLLNKIAFRTQNKPTGSKKPLVKTKKNYQNEYSIIQGTPDLIKNPEELVIILEQNGIPYDWFKNYPNGGMTASRNKLIKEYISSIFLNDEQTLERIKKFKKYLSNKNITW